MTGADGVVDVTNDTGIFSELGGTIKLIAREGNAAPGTEPGVNFSVLRDPVLNDIGQTAFIGFLTDVGVDSIGGIGIFRESNDSLELVAQDGDAAPGTSPGVSFSGFNQFPPVLNNVGQTAFGATLVGAGVDSTNDRGYFSESDGTLSLVAREGDVAPDTEPNVYLSDFFSPPLLSNASQTVFLSFLTGTGVDNKNNMGIFSKSAEELSLVARTGNPAPGTEAGVNFRGLGTPLLNDEGQVAFAAILTGTSVDSTNDAGIFATDLTGSVQLIVREGDTIDVNPDPSITDNRTIRSLDLLNGSGGSDGRRNSFNNASQLAFKLVFTDDTAGIFVATVRVPEPEAVTLLVSGCLVLLVYRPNN